MPRSVAWKPFIAILSGSGTRKGFTSPSTWSIVQRIVWLQATWKGIGCTFPTTAGRCPDAVISSRRWPAKPASPKASSVAAPGGSGFDLLEQLDDPPAVIFVTAYDQYAIRAFEVNAVDYLLKPIHPERLETALKRVLPAAAQLPASPRELTMQDRVFIDTGHRRIFAPLVSICAVCAEGDYTKLYASDGDTFMVRRSLKGKGVMFCPMIFSESTGMRSSTCAI